MQAAGTNHSGGGTVEHRVLIALITNNMFPDILTGEGARACQNEPSLPVRSALPLPQTGSEMGPVLDGATKGPPLQVGLHHAVTPTMHPRYPTASSKTFQSRLEDMINTGNQTATGVLLKENVSPWSDFSSVSQIPGLPVPHLGWSSY